MATGEARPRTNLTPSVARQIVETARRYGLPPLLVLEVMRQESAFRRNATSYKNGRPCAHGLMQLVRATAGRFGVWDPYDPRQAVEGGCRYLAWLAARYGRDRLDLVLAAYNAGEGAVDRHGRRVPPYAETQSYVRRILAEYERATRLEAALKCAIHTHPFNYVISSLPTSRLPASYAVVRQWHRIPSENARH